MAKHPDIPVVCTVCSTRMYAVAAQIGKGMRCPDCHTVTVVKEPPRPKTKPKPKPEVPDGYKLQGDSNDIIKMTCTSCHDPIRARAEHAGRKVRCPNCEEINVVPRASGAGNASSNTNVQMTDGLSANPTKKQVADRIMARAREELRERDEEIEIPEVPVQPFVTGVFNFPFYGNILVMWVTLAACMALMGTLLHMSVTRMLEQSFSMGAGLFIGLAFGVVFATTIYIFPSKFLRITESTSTGFDNVEFETVDFFERMIILLMLFNAAAFGSIPGIAVVSAMGISSGLGLVTSFVLSPFILLSMLDNSSAWAIYSDRIRQSLTTASGSWVMFYCVTIPMCVGALISFILATLNEEMEMAIAIAAILFPLVGVIYFRMLGRLALMIGQAEVENSVQGLSTDG